MRKKIQITSHKSQNQKLSSGFTLIELLIVIVIIGILSTLVISNFISIRQRARDAQRKTDLRQLQTAIQLFNSDQGSYPAISDLPVCGNQFTKDGVTYMKQIPCDPLKATQPPSYIYITLPVNSSCSTLDPSNPCTEYTLTACLENSLDSDTNAKRNFTTPLGVNCPSNRYPFTVTNP